MKVRHVQVARDDCKFNFPFRSSGGERDERLPAASDASLAVSDGPANSFAGWRSQGSIGDLHTIDAVARRMKPTDPSWGSWRGQPDC
jgi:hypothetical protein